MLPAVSDTATSAQAALALALAYAAGFATPLTKSAGLDGIDALLARLAPG